MHLASVCGPLAAPCVWFNCFKMGNFVSTILFHNRTEKNHDEEPHELLSIPMQHIEGEHTTMEELMRGHKLTIVVVVASK